MTTWHPCSNLNTRETLWVSSDWNAKNGDGRPASCVSWGVSAASIAGSYGSAYATDVLTRSWAD